MLMYLETKRHNKIYADQHGNMLNSGIKSLEGNIQEEPLPAGGSCLLGSINLAEFVKNPFTGKAEIDSSSLVMATRIAVRALNDVLLEGLPLHPLQEQRDSVRNWRQIGLGTLGLGDMLIKLGVKYGSSESLNVINDVYRLIAHSAVMESMRMAMEHGAFPQCADATKQAIVNSDFIRQTGFSEDELADIREYGLYNSQLLTCAPTGTIGTMLQVSTGVEPNFAFSYNRRTVSLNQEETTYKVDAKIVADFKAITSQSVLPNYFVSSADIPYDERIAVQATLQRYIDASISSTVNLPHETTVEQVADLYMEAWKQGLKGITIYRDGCQREGILSTEKQEADKEAVRNLEPAPIKIREVSDDCIGRKRKLTTGCGSLHLTCFYDRKTGQLLETYCSKGSTGGCMNFMNGLSRMMSLAARAGVPIEQIVDQLKSSGTCPSFAVRKATKGDTSTGSSCPVAIGNALMTMYNELQREIKAGATAAYIQPIKETGNRPAPPKCPSCGEPIQMVEGCMTCSSCGYSKCS